MVESKCKSCGYFGVKDFLSLGNIPPVNAFILPHQVEIEKKYPLNLAYCPNCFLVQLKEIVSPEELFRDYLHLSSASSANINHLKETADYLSKKLSINQSTKILEIGSNDGTLLQFFKKYTSEVLGVDPAKNLIGLNKEKGIDYLAEFFNTKTASEILKTKGKYDLIIGLNVVPHTPDNIDLLKAARILLKDEGVLVIEGVYALETILRGEFDTIYHEHVYTFSLHSLINTFRMAGMKVIDVEKIPTQGGSLRVYSMKEENAKEVSGNVKKIISEEKELGLYSSNIYDSISNKVLEYKKILRNNIEQQKLKHGKLIGLGAPARGVVIMNYCGIDNNDLKYVVDDTTLKQGKVVPGTHVPVKSFDSLDNENNPNFILFSWNYKDNIIERLKRKFARFSVIVPFPKIEILQYG